MEFPLSSADSYYLRVKVNNCIPTIKLEIAFGMDLAIINKKTYEKLGVKFLHQDENTNLYGRSGAKVALLGYFFATVNLHGRLFFLPLYVTNENDTPNLVGREWLNILGLNLNPIFKPYSLLREQYESPFLDNKYLKIQRKSIHQENDSIKPFRIPVCLSASELKTVFETKMIIDSAVKYSRISYDLWENMGRPHLEDCNNVTVSDIANVPLDFAGWFMAKVNFPTLGGEVYDLPLLVTAQRNTEQRKTQDTHNIFGRNWFHLEELDFNEILEFERVNVHNCCPGSE